MKPRLLTQEKLQIGLLAGVWLWAAIKPLDRGDWLLENLLVFLSFLALASTWGRFRISLPRLSLPSYWLFTLFMCLHLYGSHYSYALTPMGFWLQDIFALDRNHYDRIVHFAFGALLCYPFRELIARQTGLHGRWLALFSLATILSLSALYELLEMLAAVIVSPELGTAFLGTQGDEWDAQKDTGLAFLGAILVIVVLSAQNSRAQGTSKP